VRALDALLPAARSAPAEHRFTMEQWAASLASTGTTYPGITTTYGATPVERIADDFVSYVVGGLRSDSIISIVEQLRFSVFAEARFQWQRMESGRPGRLFGDASLALLETPWPGGTTGDLLSRMLLHADLAGNAYVARIGRELVLLRPDWTDILLAARVDDAGRRIGHQKVGYAYREGGLASADPVVFLADEVAHFAPFPDPLASYRGMSWLTPVVREIEGDRAATEHKLKFFEHAATPNLAISMPLELPPEQFREFEKLYRAGHEGADNAYRTLLIGGGADLTVIGSNLQQLDFKVTQGAGETRICAAGGVPAVLAGISEGLQGSSLNAGNYAAAKRRFADATVRPLWRNAAGSLQVIVPPPAGARLWWDGRDIPFLRDDEKDLSAIQNQRANTIRTLVDAGYDPPSVIQAVEAEDFTLLKHSGWFSVQLQQPGSAAAAAEPPA
jgi:phage portal protein BeeE